jgi:ComF family protein
MEGIEAAFLMEGLAREMVHRLKYGNLRAIAPVMAELMVEQVSVGDGPIDIVVPVPLHGKRERQRGYNQAHLLAREVAKLLAIRFEPKGLARRQDTPSQVGLEGIEARRANVSEAFEARTAFPGPRVLVVDDVCTSGAMLEACATALKARSATNVQGLVFAR